MTEFEQLQPHEFYKRLDGYQWREEHENSMAAYWVSCLMSVHTKKPVKPTDLWKPKKKNKEPPI